MFNYLIEAQEKYGHGTHGYAKCAELAREAASRQTEAAAGHTLLGIFAEDFIDRNERMALNSADTASVFDQYAAAIALLEKAFKSADAATILGALNTVAVSRYQQG